MWTHIQLWYEWYNLSKTVEDPLDLDIKVVGNAY